MTRKFLFNFNKLVLSNLYCQISSNKKKIVVKSSILSKIRIYL